MAFLGTLMNTYDGAADTVESLIDKLLNEQGGASSEQVDTLTGDVNTAKTTYKFNENITDYENALPDKATNINIQNQTDVSVDLSSPYTSTTVQETGLLVTKTPITLGQESQLVKVVVNDVNKQLLEDYNKTLYDTLSTLADELDSITVSTGDFDYVERPETFYKALYQSGFLSILKDFSVVSGVERFCEKLDIEIPGFDTNIPKKAKTFGDLVDDLSFSITEYVNDKLGYKGFKVPKELLSVTDTYIRAITDYTKGDYVYSLSVMLDKLESQAQSNKLSIAELEEEFTKHINNGEILLHKTLLAAKEAQTNGELDLAVSSFKGQGQKIRAVADYFKYIDQAINVYKLNMQASASLSQAWSAWVDAVVTKEKIGLDFNQLYLDEFKGLLKEKAEVDKFKKMLLDNYTKLAELNSDQLIAEKKLELEKNATELMVYAAKLDFAKRHLKQFEVELKAFSDNINFIYEKYKVTADLIPAIADVSVAGAKGLASVIGDSKIKLTTYKK